jgi:hypothetical protein
MKLHILENLDHKTLHFNVLMDELHCFKHKLNISENFFFKLLIHTNIVILD